MKQFCFICDGPIFIVPHNFVWSKRAVLNQELCAVNKHLFGGHKTVADQTTHRPLLVVG